MTTGDSAPLKTRITDTILTIYNVPEDVRKLKIKKALDLVKQVEFTLDKPYMLGDINNNGIIDSMDYVLLKRAYFGTYELKNIAVGDINKNGSIDSMDYVYLRRAYFGTYKLNANEKVLP